MGRDIFRIFKPGGSGEDPAAKRRGQLRQAQQTYRRKDRYMKALESELIQATKREAKLVQEIERLRASSEAFTRQPSHHARGPPMLQPSNDIRVDDYTNNTLTLASSSSTPVASLPNLALNQQASNPQAVHSSCEANTINSSRFLDTSLYTDDHDNIGMQFVLILESICLGHIHGDPSKHDEPSGHALTATVLLQSEHSSDSSQNVFTSQISPTKILSRLLALSPALCSNTEVTPVQIWERIQSEPKCNGLDVPRLKRLAEKLREAAKCHGFGAVVESLTVDNLLSEEL